MWLEAQGKANLTALMQQYSLNENLGEHGALGEPALSQHWASTGPALGRHWAGRGLPPEKEQAHTHTWQVQNHACLRTWHLSPTLSNSFSLHHPASAACLTEKREGCPGISNDQLNTTTANTTAKASGRRLRTRV